MKLRTIEIMGFKSFRDLVRLEISDGMTCIVGPNGCGKSNVVDAIKWAMGDMSPKSLRGDSMRDVIFAGTEKAKAAGMAEVTLTFENTDTFTGDEGDDNGATEEGPGGGDDEEEERKASADWNLGKSIPREFQGVTEIAITRRLHRSGDSEYLINKVTCRLRDIQNLLAGTGLGKQGYSIVEQGQIGFIVNARPSERRLIIEEASGITRYKDRRKRSARKLDRTEANLRRTSDLCDEIEKQMGVLEKQAEKARKHREIAGELEGLEVALLLRKRHDAAQSEQTLKRKLQSAEKRVQARVAKLEETEKNLVVARKKARQADERHADLTENFYKVETRLNLARSNREHTLEARQQAADRIEELHEERERQRERREHFREELERAKADLASVGEKPGGGDDEVVQLEQRLASLKGERKELVSHRDELRRRIEGRRAKIRRIGDRLEWLDGQLGEFDARQTSLAEELEAATEEERDLKRHIGRLSLDLERAREAIEDGRRQLESAQETYRNQLAKVGEVSRREERLARRRLELEARIESLEAMRKSGDGYAEGGRWNLEWAREEGRDDVYGPAAEFLQVPEGTDAAYAAYFGARLQDVVVRDRETALEIIEKLVTEEVGRVGCRPLPKGVEGPEQLVANWPQEVEIVDDLSEVAAAEEGDPGSDGGWVTPGGEVMFADGRIVGGSAADRSEELLRQARQLENLREEFRKVDEEYAQAREDLELVREDAGVCEEDVEAAKGSLRRAEHRTRGIEQELQAERREIERAQGRLERLKGRREEEKSRRQGLKEEVVSRREQRDELVGTLPDDEEALMGAEADVEALDARIDDLGSSLTQRKVERAQIDERRRHLEKSVERYAEAIEDATNQLERMTRETQEQKVRRDEARMRAEALAGEVERLRRDHLALQENVEEAQSVCKDISEHVQSLELAVLARRQDVEESREEVQELKMAVQKAQLAMEHATDQLLERFELTVDKARRKAMEVETPVDDQKQRAATLKRRLRRLGEVNPLAIEEFEEARERFEFHSAQQADLEESVANLRQAIARMDRESRRRFGETFEAVNERFQQVFPQLFRGGEARLILTDPEDLLETGVDIEVRPPGKKLQNVSLLSGGEKALTAVSLIFSIFMLKPSPFAVLDEVDAPLDDANVGRFAEMVRELSEISQMIVITHNRTTMEAPQKLYGVTMEEAGVSKLVSVNLSDVGGRLAS